MFSQFPSYLRLVGARLEQEGELMALALAAVSAARVAAGRDAIVQIPFRHDGHNLMRYRPSEVAAAIASIGASAVTDPRTRG